MIRKGLGRDQERIGKEQEGAGKSQEMTREGLG
jgi:hypothetical protein